MEVKAFVLFFFICIKVMKAYYYIFVFRKSCINPTFIWKQKDFGLCTP